MCTAVSGLRQRLFLYDVFRVFPGGIQHIAKFHLTGVSYGGFVALLPAVTADYFSGTNISGILGALYTSVGIGSLLGPTFAGFMFDLQQSYAIPFAASMFAAVTASE